MPQDSPRSPSGIPNEFRPLAELAYLAYLTRLRAGPPLYGEGVNLAQGLESYGILVKVHPTTGASEVSLVTRFRP